MVVLYFECGYKANTMSRLIPLTPDMSLTGYHGGGMVRIEDFHTGRRKRVGIFIFPSLETSTSGSTSTDDNGRVNTSLEEGTCICGNRKDGRCGRHDNSIGHLRSVWAIGPENLLSIPSPVVSSTPTLSSNARPEPRRIGNRKRRVAASPVDVLGFDRSPRIRKS